jgi:hypothetical protein
MTNGGDISKTFGITMMSGELTTLIYDLRWAVALCASLIIADLWLGCRTASMMGKAVRKSRAIRRTANKFVDYLMYMLVAAMIGMVVEQMGWWTHTTVALFGIMLGCFCEIESIWGHWAKLHGYTFSIRKVILRFISTKSKDVADIISEEINQVKDDNNN